MTPTATDEPTELPTPTATPTTDACPATPAICSGAAKGLLKVKYPEGPGKRRLQWKWQKGITGATQSSFGDPVAGDTTYRLCLYDEIAGAAELQLEVVVAAGGTCSGKPCWRALGEKGWSYKSRTGLPSGVTKILVKSGAAGRPSVQVQGAGTGLLLPPPVGSEYFDQDTTVTIQLHAGEAGCWSSSFDASATSQNRADRFTASMP